MMPNGDSGDKNATGDLGSIAGEVLAAVRRESPVRREKGKKWTGFPRLGRLNMIPSTAGEMGKHSNPKRPVEFGESISSIYGHCHEWEAEWSK